VRYEQIDQSKIAKSDFIEFFAFKYSGNFLLGKQTSKVDGAPVDFDFRRGQCLFFASFPTLSEISMRLPLRFSVTTIFNHKTVN
jgi:hypothetical protein